MLEQILTNMWPSADVDPFGMPETYALYSSPGRVGPSSASVESNLTDRQIGILRHLAQGHDIEHIADQLGYSVSTIKKEVHQTIRRCGARNRAHAVAIAIRAGII